MAMRTAGRRLNKNKCKRADFGDSLDALDALEAQQELMRSCFRKDYGGWKSGPSWDRKVKGASTDTERQGRMMSYEHYAMQEAKYRYDAGSGFHVDDDGQVVEEFLAVPGEGALVAEVLELSKPLSRPPIRPVALPALGGSSLAGAAVFIALVSLGAALPVALVVAGTGAAVAFGSVVLASVPYRAHLQRATALRSARQRLALVAAKVNDRPSRERLEAAAGRIEGLTDSAGRLKGQEGRKAVLAVAVAASRLVTYLASHPERTPGSRKFLEYYPEAAEELAAALLEMETNGITCKDEDRAREQAVAALHELAQAFDAHIVAVNDYRVLGISATTEALRSSLRSEGFLRGPTEGTSVGEAAPAAVPEEPRDASMVPVQEPLAGGLTATQRAAIRGRGSESLI